MLRKDRELSWLQLVDVRVYIGPYTTLLSHKGVAKTKKCDAQISELAFVVFWDSEIVASSKKGYLACCMCMYVRVCVCVCL